MKHLYAWIYLLLIVSGCEVIDPDEAIPSYISIDTSHLQTDYLTEGTASHQFEDIWINVDGADLGTFEMPFTIPVIAEGSTPVRLRPGIKLNGISSTRIAHPHMSFMDTIADFRLLDTVTMAPVFNYFPNVIFAYREDFEITNTIERDGGDVAITTVDDEEAFEGFKSAAIYLNNTNDEFRGRTRPGTGIAFPSGSPSVLLEMNYRCNNAFYVYFGAVSATGNVEIPVLRINESETWNKIYVNFSPLVRDYQGYSEYYILFYALKVTSAPTAFIYLDNLKLVSSP